MNLSSLIPRLVPRTFQPVQPALAAEIAESHVALVRLAGSSSRPSLAGFWSSELAPGVVFPSPAHPNIAEPAVLASQIAAAKARVAPGGGALALCLPDSLFRISVVSLDRLPAGRDDQREVVAWKLRKTLPYRIEDASVAWQVLGEQAEGVAVLAAAARRKVVAEYEALLERHGFRVGSVTASTLALCEALPVHPAGTLLVHAGSGWFSLLVTDGAHPTLLRCKLVPPAERGTGARDAMILAEVPPTLEYHVGRLGRERVERVFVHSCDGAEELAARLQDQLLVPVEGLPWLAEALPPDTMARLLPARVLAQRGLRGAAVGGAA